MAAVVAPPPPALYARRRPEDSTRYKVVQDNLATLYAAVDDGALSIRLPDFVRKELEGFLDCGLLCRGFAHALVREAHEIRCKLAAMGAATEPYRASRALRIRSGADAA